MLNFMLNNKPCNRWNIHSDQGLTLLEMLISMSAFVIIMAVLSGSFITFSKSSTTESVRAGLQQEIRSGLNIMIYDIRHAGLDPFRVDDTGDLDSRPYGITKAETGTISLVSDKNLDDSVNTTDVDNTGFEEISYFLSGDNIIQRVNGDASGASDLIVMNNVDNLSFTYYDDEGDLTTDENEVNTVEVSITLDQQAGSGPEVSRTLATRVNIRNEY
ncbi:MAG: prepilin-type N-terminal cleavage/methylation domain-containing protein [Desulfobacterales bacterium]|nr:prepilin-type N-terminal cleavage/methylation domain-containing protein [Desulfobacterales bacterium]